MRCSCLSKTKILTFTSKEVIPSPIWFSDIAHPEGDLPTMMMFVHERMRLMDAHPDKALLIEVLHPFASLSSSVDSDISTLQNLRERLRSVYDLLSALYLTNLPAFIPARSRLLQDREIRSIASEIWTAGILYSRCSRPEPSTTPQSPTTEPLNQHFESHDASALKETSTEGLKLNDMLPASLLAIMSHSKALSMTSGELANKSSGKDILADWVLGSNPNTCLWTQQSQDTRGMSASQPEDDAQKARNRTSRSRSISQAPILRIPWKSDVRSIERQELSVPPASEGVDQRPSQERTTGNRDFAIVIENSQPSQNAPTSMSQAEPGRFGGVLPRRGRRLAGF